MHDVTTDTFFDGKITVRQTRLGYRYSIDAVILAGHARPRKGDRLVDLGTGCGIVPLIIASRHTGVDMIGVEIQEDLAGMARENVQANRFEKQIEILCMDMKALDINIIQGPVDMVLSNPPFHRMSSGRINPNSQRAVARHEIKITIGEVTATAGRLLRTGGDFLCIYPVDRLVALLANMRSSLIEPKYIRLVQSNATSQARLVLVQGKKRGNPGLSAAVPLVIYEQDGQYSDEMQRMFTI